METMNKVQAFLYLLIKNTVTPGVVEELVQEIECAGDSPKFVFSNSYLAEYAKELAERLTDES